MADTINLQEYFETPQSRRSVLRQLGALAGVSLALNACSTPPSTNPVQGPTASGPARIDSIKHIVFACQENRTFDNYFGYYPKAGKFAVPPAYSHPNGKEGTAPPNTFKLLE